VYLAIFYCMFGIFLLTSPKAVVKRLYSVAGWTRRYYLLSAIGKPFSLACLALIVFSPIKAYTLIFWIGNGLYIAGCLVMFTALFTYRNTPIDQPVRSEIYQYSRNPQWLGLIMIFVGTCLVCANGLALILVSIGIILYHFRILGEESACLGAYGQSYREYMAAVPRYFGLRKEEKS
jgi:protein-S-isoprenylcysteine O-methyltransferase Ste14